MEFDKHLVQQLADMLLDLRQNIAVAESVTAGLLQAAVASGENASGFFEGGVTTYNIDQKSHLLHIDVGNALKCNCVSEQTAGEMALGVSKLFSSHWGVGITGYASPVPGYTEKGLYACAAISFKNKIVFRHTIRHTVQEPLAVQLAYVNTLLRAIIDTIERTTG